MDGSKSNVSFRWCLKNKELVFFLGDQIKTCLLTIIQNQTKNNNLYKTNNFTFYFSQSKGLEQGKQIYQLN